MPVTVLIVEDEDLLREDLAVLLGRKGYKCATAASAEEALEQIPRLRPHIIVTDIVMSGMSGIEMIEKALAIFPDTAVIVMTAFGTLETAIDAFRHGAADYVLKPLVAEDIIGKIGRIAEHKRMTDEVSYLRRRVAEVTDASTMLGQSNSMREVGDLIEKVAPTKSTVLISGESGTGKELVARAIHDKSAFRDEPFIAINCSGLQENLLESELFGHVKGAFTGAVTDKAGLFEVASGGTVFLDEISEMPLGLQSKLLRVIEQREFLRVGGTELSKLRARIVAATNRDLKNAVESGQFRGDLYYRIAVFEIGLPLLRQHADDVPVLVDHFVAKFNREMNRSCEGVDPKALEALMSYGWPGNVRELRNVIERAMILCSGPRIGTDHLPSAIAGPGPGASATNEPRLKEAVQAYESALIRRALDEAAWNKEKAARRLGINPSTLYRKMADLSITPPD